MYCRKCGKQIQDDSVFCPYCGARQNLSDIEDHRKNLLQEVLLLIVIILLAAGAACQGYDLYRGNHAAKQLTEDIYGDGTAETVSGSAEQSTVSAS